MTTPDTTATQAQIATLEALKERVERGERNAHLEHDIQDALGCGGLEILDTYEAADAFERAVYPMEPGEDAYITTREGGECEYERLPCVTYAPTIPAAKVIWVLVRRMKELRERENADHE